VSPRFVSLGEIVTTHGLGGWLKLNCYNPDSTVLSPARQVFLERQGIRSPQEIESSQRYRGGQFLVKLRGVDSLTEAEKWVGFVLSVPEEALPSLPSGEYYHYQAIGLEVLDGLAIEHADDAGAHWDAATDGFGQVCLGAGVGGLLPPPERRGGRVPGLTGDAGT
jgi:hypothetical protein